MQMASNIFTWDHAISQIHTMIFFETSSLVSNNKLLVCQPIRQEEFKTFLFSDWLTYLATNHKVFVIQKQELMFRTKHGNSCVGWAHMILATYSLFVAARKGNHQQQSCLMAMNIILMQQHGDKWRLPFVNVGNGLYISYLLRHLL